MRIAGFVMRLCEIKREREREREEQGSWYNQFSVAHSLCFIRRHATECTELYPYFLYYYIKMLPMEMIKTLTTLLLWYESARFRIRFRSWSVQRDLFLLLLLFLLRFILIVRRLIGINNGKQFICHVQATKLPFPPPSSSSTINTFRLESLINFELVCWLQFQPNKFQKK